jgi:hypothetical protein
MASAKTGFAAAQRGFRRNRNGCATSLADGANARISSVMGGAQTRKTGACLALTTAHASHTTTSMLYGTEGSGNGGRVEQGFHGLLFLYGQDLAPFRKVRWLPAFRRACLSTPLYKNNPFGG